MNNDVLENKVIIELKELIQSIKTSKLDFDAYTACMKQIILNTYSAN